MSSRNDAHVGVMSGVVHLFDFDASIFGAGVLRFSPDAPNALGQPIVFGNQVYDPLPMQAQGFDKNSGGSMPRPIIRVSALGGVLAQLAMQYNDLLGMRVTRTRVFTKYLDAVNFSAGNPQADANQYLDREIWFIERKATENEQMIEWELASPFDVHGVMLPRRQYIQGVCPWVYRGADCGYSGGAVATENDAPTADPAQDRCGKGLNSCSLRFGGSELPFGGFPGTGRAR